MLKVLIACEESQTVCKAFRERGFEAYSCDIQEPSGGHPEWHILGDVLPILNGRCAFQTMDGVTHCIDGRWDLIIAHPPCTDLAASGARWFPEKQKDFRQQKACVFFMQFVLADCEYIAVENPVGIMSTVYGRPNQIIQPYQFGEHARKATCLWLKGVPILKPTKTVDCGSLRVYANGKSFSSGACADYAVDENGKILSWNDPRTAKARSKTFPGIARAMAEQWGDYILEAEGMK